MSGQFFRFFLRPVGIAVPDIDINDRSGRSAVPRWRSWRFQWFPSPFLPAWKRRAAGNDRGAGHQHQKYGDQQENGDFAPISVKKYSSGQPSSNPSITPPPRMAFSGGISLGDGGKITGMYVEGEDMDGGQHGNQADARQSFR